VISLYSSRIACNSAILSTPVLAGGLGGGLGALSEAGESALEDVIGFGVPDTDGLAAGM